MVAEEVEVDLSGRREGHVVARVCQGRALYLRCMVEQEGLQGEIPRQPQVMGRTVRDLRPGLRRAMEGLHDPLGKKEVPGISTIHSCYTTANYYYYYL